MNRWTVETPFARAPFQLTPDDVEVFAVGDVHGQAAAFEAMLAHVAGVKTRPGRKRLLVQTGDVIDRGPENLRAMALALNARELARVDEVVLLPGNHELMLLEVLDDAEAAVKNDSFYGTHLGVWAMNGGLDVLDELLAVAGAADETKKALLNDNAALAQWLCDVFERGPLADGAPGAWLRALRAGPDHLRVGQTLLVHAGVHPRLDQDRFLATPRAGHRRAQHHWAWVRDPFLQWQPGFKDPKGDPMLVVHGHTPAFKKPVWRHEDENAVVACMDRMLTHGRLNVDAGATARPHVGAARLNADGYQMFVAQA